jgi:small subunit ribosomal protein S4e
MGSKGNKRHLKRLNTPGFLRIHRKTNKFSLKPRPGPHPKQFCLSIGHVLRDLLKLTNNAKETNVLLKQRKVLVDGTVRVDPNFPLGLMDVFEIPDISKAYRVLPSQKHGLIVSEITKEEAKFKLCRIENISVLKKGASQLNLHDGRNITIPADKSEYETKGTLKLSLPSQEILGFYPMKENSQAIICHGKNIGMAGKLVQLIERFGVNASVAVIETSEGVNINTAYDYAFVIGSDQPSIDLPMEI